MAITYKSQGAGVSTETSAAALSPLCPATVDAGDILIAHVFWEDTITTPLTPSGWTLLSGPQLIQFTIARHWVYGRIADGTEDGAAVAFGSQAVTTQRAARIYSFAGRVAGAIANLVGNNGFPATSHALDPYAPDVTTTHAGSLAVCLAAQNKNNATGSFTGETGGNWTQAVAAYTAALTPGLTLQIQTCTPTSDPGTVTGGTFNTVDDPVGCIGFQIRDSVPGVGSALVIFPQSVAGGSSRATSSGAAAVSFTPAARPLGSVGNAAVSVSATGKGRCLSSGSGIADDVVFFSPLSASGVGGVTTVSGSGSASFSMTVAAGGQAGTFPYVDPNYRPLTYPRTGFPWTGGRYTITDAADEPDFLHGSLCICLWLEGTAIVRPHLSGKLIAVPHLLGDIRTNP